jgi:tripartite-type tricarboxylate transporter receptor subunit TctC
MARRSRWLIFAIGVLVSTPPIRAVFAQDNVADFYRGKQIQLVIGYSVGGTYDLYARLIARYLGQFIPGHPTVVPINMPGAGSRTAASWVYSVAPRDGTVLGTADQSLALVQAMGDESLRVDISKLIYIGNPNSDNDTFVTWHTSGVETIEDAKKKEIPIGAVGGPGGGPSSQFPAAMNSILGTKFRIVYGYPGGNEINMAMETGEVAGFGSDTWSAWKASHPDWIRDKKINFLVQIGLQKAPDLDAPLLMDEGATRMDRDVLKLLSTPSEIGRPVFTTPGVPEERVAALRRAFEETMRDPGFERDAAKAHAALNPMSGAALQKLVLDVADAPPPLVAELKKAITAQSGPSQ